jgi:hypothetical protein
MDFSRNHHSAPGESRALAKDGENGKMGGNDERLGGASSFPQILWISCE